MIQNSEDFLHNFEISNFVDKVLVFIKKTVKTEQPINEYEQ